MAPWKFVWSVCWIESISVSSWTLLKRAWIFVSFCLCVSWKLTITPDGRVFSTVAFFCVCKKQMATFSDQQVNRWECVGLGYDHFTASQRLTTVSAFIFKETELMLLTFTFFFLHWFDQPNQWRDKQWKRNKLKVLLLEIADGYIFSFQSCKEKQPIHVEFTVFSF